MKNFRSISLEYLERLSAFFIETRAHGEATRELSYRPVLDWYFDQLVQHFNPEAGKTFEPKKQARAGRPDWRFHDKKNFGVYGYVEAKGLETEKRIDPKNNLDQIKRYLELRHKLILTDGLDFVFFDEAGGGERTLSLIKKPARKIDVSDSPDLSRLETEFSSFFSTPKARIVSEDSLVSEAAKRARFLADDIFELSDLPEGSGMTSSENETIKVLKELKSILQEHHDPVLNDRKHFAAFVAQVLVFGLLYAHRVTFSETDEPRERYRKIREFWQSSSFETFSKHLNPFRALITTLHDELSQPGPIGTWYEDCCQMLAHSTFESDAETKPDYHLFFERFLAAFDPQTRFDFGAFYTPESLSRYILRVSKEIVEKELPKVDLYDRTNKLIDPCCGTGSFIEQLLRDSVKDGKKPRIVGFEILPGPYALAHYRIALVAGEYPDNVDIVLTNTLSDELENEIAFKDESNLFKQEQELAQRLAKPPFTLIIGNPPSSDSPQFGDASRFSIIQHLLTDFRPPEGKRRSRQNTQKQLQNEFVKFLRWSANKLMASPQGLLAFVIPSSFAEQPSYRYAREWIAKNFDAIWVLDIDSDTRAGSHGENLFKTLQGRSVLFLLKDSQPREVHPAGYATISALKAVEKESWLEKRSIDKDLLSDYYSFESVNYLLRPSRAVHGELYSKFWNLHKTEEGERFIFDRHCSGIKMAPSSLLTHALRELLFRRSRKISDYAIPPESIILDWFSGQDKPPRKEKLTVNVRKAVEVALRHPDVTIRRYSYRPFTENYALIDEGVFKALAKEKNSGTRYRPEILSAFSNEGAIGLAVSPATKDIDGNLHRFASFCWELPDNDLTRRGNAQIYCNYFPEYKSLKRKAWNAQPFSNINESLMELVLAEEEAMVFYCYAVLSSQRYLSDFEGELFGVADHEKPPRIPITKDGKLFKALSAAGKELALLEKTPDLDSFKFSKQSKQFLDIFSKPFRLESFDVEEESLSVRLSGPGTNLTLTGISPKVLGYKISGYQVLQQWLKVRRVEYLRAEFDERQFREFVSLIQRIGEQIEKISVIDALVGRVLEGDLL